VEAFESIVAVALEADGFVVSPAVKFPVRLKTKKAMYEEWQTHGYEVDLVGARNDQLVLATVKSFFGSAGVNADHVMGTTNSERKRKRYALLNDRLIRPKILRAASERYGYPKDQIQLRLYVGRFAGRIRKEHEGRIRKWAKTRQVGMGPIEVFGVDEVVDKVLREASSKQYRDNPALATIKALREAGHELAPKE
jgi:hypothetical protein